MCDFLKRRRKEVSFRLQYPFGQKTEGAEAQETLDQITLQLDAESELLQLREAAAYKYWDRAEGLHISVVKKLDKCLWPWSKEPHPKEKRTEDEDGLDWPYHEDVYPQGGDESFYVLDK